MTKFLSFFILTLFCTHLAHAQLSKKLICSNNNFYDGSFMYGKVYLETELVVEDVNSFILKDLKFYFQLSMESNFSYIWEEVNVFEENSIHENLKTYNPRVYKNHIKFNDIYEKRIFGLVDLIFPLKEITSPNNSLNFNAYTIMTAIGDHWGGTVALSCTTSKSEQL